MRKQQIAPCLALSMAMAACRALTAGATPNESANYSANEAAPDKEKTPAEIARAAFPSVVLIATQDPHGQPLSLGSGFFVEKNIIATNFHVIEGAAAAYAKVIGQPAKLAVEGIVGLDVAHDLVLLQPSNAAAPALAIGTQASVSIGDPVFAIGNPRGLEGTFSQGIVSSVRELGSDRILQVTAPISPGSSGGPVLNRYGAVVGVSVASITNGQNLNFAIPADYVKTLQTKRTELRPFRSIPQTRAAKSMLGQIGQTPARKGVVGENLTYDRMGVQTGDFSFSIRNTLSDDIANLRAVIVFYDTRDEPIDVYPVEYEWVIPAGLAKRITGRVDASVERLNCPLEDPAYEYPPPRIPKGKIDFRVLDFTIR
jgi:S1-C subfamily serine protease